MSELRAEPDAFVGVVPTTWNHDNVQAVLQTHRQHWHEEIDIELEPSDADDIFARGELRLNEDTVIPLVVEDPIEELMNLIPTSKEPYTPTEAMLIKQQKACWRFVIEDGAERGKDAASDFAKVSSTLIEAGGAGVFMPGTAALHSPSFIKLVTMDLSHPQAMTNLCVNCWDADGWMATRGLTAFGLPELETEIDEGPNSAYFRLMDIAAGMINQGTPYPTGAKLSVGPQAFTLVEGRNGPEDEQVPISGAFGVMTIKPQ
ncbi:MAG: hypothetical protein ACQEVA_12415 [Myxococcota bacterium]